MGRECVCSARFSWIEKNAKREGKALLEEHEIVFRGDPRVKLVRGDISALTVVGEELVVTCTLGKARFELSAAEAEKWRTRFVSPPSLMDKLGVKGAHIVMLHGPVPDDVVASAKKAGAAIAKSVSEDITVILAAARAEDDLPKVTALAKKVKGTTRLWLLYPRGSKALPEAAVRKALLATGLVDNKTARIDDTWTSLQFVVRKENRA